MDIFTRRKIHDGVCAPACGPDHFIDLFFDRRGDRGVSDIGVDFGEEIPPDDHRLQFWVVDIGGDDGASAGDSSRTNSGVIFSGMAAPQEFPWRRWSRAGFWGCSLMAARFSARRRFSRRATNSISGVMMPWRA